MGVGESGALYYQWIEDVPGASEALSEDDFETSHRWLPLRPVLTRDDLEQLRVVRLASTVYQYLS